MRRTAGPTTGLISLIRTRWIGLTRTGSQTTTLRPGDMARTTDLSLRWWAATTEAGSVARTSPSASQSDAPSHQGANNSPNQAAEASASGWPWLVRALAAALRPARAGSCCQTIGTGAVAAHRLETAGRRKLHGRAQGVADRQTQQASPAAAEAHRGGRMKASACRMACRGRCRKETDRTG